jgi:hypothetical protein
MSSLFLRTVSQGLQAFMPIAVALIWFRRRDDASRASAIRRGLILSMPATVVASWWFQRSVHRALDEAMLAAFAVVVALMAGLPLWRGGDMSRKTPPREPHPAVFSALAAAVILIVVRQTMEIGSVLATAAFELRSLAATSTIVEGVAIAAGIPWLWTRFGRRLSRPSLVSATRVFTAVFVAQVVIYAFHEFAEARLLPWSEVLHAATEPYGPDGIYGVHFSDLLVLAPLAAAAATLARSQMPEARTRAWRVVAQRRLAVGTIIGASVMFMGMQHDDARPAHPSAGASTADIAAILVRPHVLFRETAPGANFGRLSLAAIDAPGVRLSTALACDRLSFAGGHGLCLHTERGVFNSYTAVLLDAGLKPGAAIKVQGLPSRTRIAADGRVGAFTVFVLGDDYASPFSTRTTMIDASSGDDIGELEQFTTWRGGVRFRAVDFNFWGVTLARDGNTFYASLRTAGTTYLVRGELALRKLTVLRDNVECPSLSPDNRLLAYKKRVGPSPDSWRLHVLDLATNVEHIISGETRYIDDQVEWLDAARVLYAVPRRTTAVSDVWVAPIDGSASARIFLPEAESPVVIR